MLLHTVNKSPFSHQSLASCAQFCTSGDAVVLLEDGVYAINHVELEKLIKSHIEIFAIKIDLAARGLTKQYDQDDKIQTISYEAFVDLCVKYPKQKNW